MSTLARPIPTTYRHTVRIDSILMVIVILGGIFQVGHFIEHAVQFGVWLAGHHSAPYMSPMAMTLTHQIGGWLFPTQNMQAQMMKGMEVLHLVGNGVFLVTLAGVLYFIPSKLVRYALYVETFHLYEHIMLTATAIFLDKPIGLSTLFGGVDVIGSHAFAVGHRVIWHFGMNLIPSGLIMMELMLRKIRRQE